MCTNVFKIIIHTFVIIRSIINELWPWAATPRPWSGLAAESARLQQRRSGGREELPHLRGQGRQTTRATTHLSAGSVGWEEQPHLQGAAAAWCRRTERSYSMFKVRRGGHEKIPLLQGKEQWLCFAEAAMKRYLMSEVRESQVSR